MDSALIANATDSSAVSDPDGLGADLVFVIGAFRSGTTLLRKMLDSHPRLHSPAETWFLLPLLEMWRGDGTAVTHSPAQAATALQNHLSRAEFLNCCRGFASAFYANRPAGTDLFIDKTPFYLKIADEIAELFPACRFLILVRDPRGMLHSRANWAHSDNADPRAHIPGVAQDMNRLAAVWKEHAPRSLLLSYEKLCTAPEAEITRATAFLDLPYDAAMLRYGDQPHHEGYGDEVSMAHAAPHTASVERWQSALEPEIQQELLAACDPAALRHLDLDELAAEASATPTQVVRPSVPSAEGPRVLAMMPPGTNSRDIFQDFVTGFRRAGASIVEYDLDPATQRILAASDPTSILHETRDDLAAVIKRESIDLTLGLWALGIGTVGHGERDGRFVSLYEMTGTPHLLFWLDSPERAHRNDFRKQFNTPVVQCPYCFNLINNPATAAEMAGVYGFGNVAPLPYGVDVERFRPGVNPCSFDIVMSMGPYAPAPTPLMQRELNSDAPDEDAIRRDLAPVLRRGLFDQWLPRVDAALRESAAGIIDVLLESQVTDRHRPLLDRLREAASAEREFAPAVAAILGDVNLYADFAAAIRELESWRRAFAITWLAQRYNCAVFGNSSLGPWDCRAEDLGYVQYNAMSHAYRRGRLGLNVMRWQDDVGVNIKPMEISASGVLCVSERRVGLDALYEPGREIAIFDTMADLGTTVDALLNDEPRRTAMAAAALARTRAEHSWTNRAAGLMSMITQAVK